MTKKYLIILVLKILEAQTDKNHPMSQIKIADEISQMFPCDRKTVGRNIAALTKMGYPIKKTSNGYYLDSKKFSVEEKDFILRCILSSNEKTQEEREDIADRVSALLNKIYRR